MYLFFLFLLKKLTDEFKPFIFVNTSYLNIDMCKFELSQKDESIQPSPLIPRKLTANLELLKPCSGKQGGAPPRDFFILLILYTYKNFRNLCFHDFSWFS